MLYVTMDAMTNAIAIALDLHKHHGIHGYVIMVIWLNIFQIVSISIFAVIPKTYILTYACLKRCPHAFRALAANVVRVMYS